MTVVEEKGRNKQMATFTSTNLLDSTTDTQFTISLRLQIVSFEQTLMFVITAQENIDDRLMTALLN